MDDVRWTLAVWLLLCALAFGVAAPRVDLPGLYYDEAFMAQQARDFLHPEREPDHAGSVRHVEVLGRPFPLRNAVYLGSLKSQLAIPSLAVFGESVRVVRLTTLAWSLVAVGFAMLFARRLLGGPAAWLTGGLLVLDPSWLFFSLYEWGPFTTGLLCRCLGLWALTVGWLDGRRGWLFVGGLACGLGVYSRADFALIVGAAAVALCACRPGIVRELWGPRRSDALTVALAAALGAAPMLVSAADLLATSAAAEIGQRGGVDEKLRVLGSVLDGSRFYRLIDWGGRFHRIWETGAPRAGLGLAAAAALAWCIVDAARRQRRERPAGPGLFLAATLAGVLAGLIVLPGAVRAHHLLNVMPFVHLAVAAAAVATWRAAGRPGRAAVAAALVALALSDVHVIARTFGLIERTGGTGRWSTALRDLAAEIDDAPTTRIYSLDWGLHEPLLFLTDEATLRQPIWRMGGQLRARGRWLQRGRGGERYLVHAPEYDLFGFSPRLLSEARRIAGREPEAVRITEHRDGTGAPVFYSVVVTRPHQLELRRSGLRLRLEGSAADAPAPGGGDSDVDDASR